MLRSLAPTALALLLLGCATVPVDAPHGTLVVSVEIGGAHLKAMELQHQDYTHAVALTGFEAGQSTMDQSLVAGRYCVERFVFDTGPAGGVILPVDMCFEVVRDASTNVRLVLGPDGGIGLLTDRGATASDPGSPPAWPD